MTEPAPDPVARPDGLRYDPEVAAAALSAADQAMGELIARIGPCTLRPEPGRTLFDRLASSIVSQQLSVAAAATIAGRLRVAAGDPDDADLVHRGTGHLDPARVAALDDDALRAAGLSRPKVAAMRDLADAVLTGRIPDLAELATLDDEDVVAALTGVRGIGRWTVEMLLLFQLGRPDVFPVADVGVRRGIERLHGLDHRPDAEEMRLLARPWEPYRSVASWYLWRSLDVVPDV